MNKIEVREDLDKREMYEFARRTFPNDRFSHMANPSTTLEAMKDIARRRGIDLIVVSEEKKDDYQIPQPKRAENQFPGNHKISKIYTLKRRVTGSDRKIQPKGTRVDESHPDFKELLERDFLEVLEIKY